MTQLPGERRLPDSEQMLNEVLADGRQGSGRGRGWKVPASAVAPVAVLAGGVYAVSTAGDDAPSRQATVAAAPHSNAAPQAGAVAPQHPGSTTQMVRPLTDAESVTYAQACLDSWQRQGHVATRPATIHSASEVPYAWVQRVGSRQNVALVITAADTGDSYACTATVQDVADVPGINAFETTPFAGPGAIKSTENSPDATHPAVPTDVSGFYGGGAKAGQPVSMAASGLYEVDDRVAQVRQRYVTDNGAGRWFTVEAHAGYVYLFSQGPGEILEAGDTITLQTQVLDAQGNLLDVPADQKGGGGLTDSPGTTRTDTFRVRAQGTDFLAIW